MNQFFTLTSTDYSTFNFSYKLASPIILDKNKEYECALVDFISDDVTNIIDCGFIIYKEGNSTHLMQLSVANNETNYSIVNNINKALEFIDNNEGNVYSSKLLYSIEDKTITHKLKNKRVLSVTEVKLIIYLILKRLTYLIMVITN